MTYIVNVGATDVQACKKSGWRNWTFSQVPGFRVTASLKGDLIQQGSNRIIYNVFYGSLFKAAGLAQTFEMNSDRQESFLPSGETTCLNRCRFVG